MPQGAVYHVLPCVLVWCVDVSEIYLSQNIPLLRMSLAEVLSSQAASLSLLAISSYLPHCSLRPVAWPAAWSPTWAILPANRWPKATFAKLILLRR